jgi:fructuronate reductase
LRLSEASLGDLAAGVERPVYARAAQAAGIVHFGIGAFHRAHQAWYTDAAMNAGERDWMIIGVSLRSGAVAKQLNPQDGLFTLSECSAEGQKSRLIGSVRKVLVASEQPEAVVAAVAAPATHIVSLTITEKGYCRAADGSLDFEAAGPDSIYAFLAAGLRRRHDQGLPGLTLLSCDNLAENGPQLARLLGAYLARHDPALASWVARECTCPQTMIDRIVPATTADDLTAIEAKIGLADHGAVMTEPFSQWVIEDRFAGPRPRWERFGAQLVGDVAAYETAKLRMLNGAHSLLAYCGLRRGYSFVHEAIADPNLCDLAERLMLSEAAPTIAPASGLDLEAYAASLIARFANPALSHRLIQIAMDGSQKIPQRWLETLAVQQSRRVDCPAILAGLAAWLSHIRGDNAADWGAVDDPMGANLAQAWSGGTATGVLKNLFGSGGLVSEIWSPDDSDVIKVVELLGD